MNQYSYLIIGILLILLIFYNQIRVRQVRQDMKLTLPIIMFILGVLNFKSYISTNSLTTMALLSIAISFSVLAFGMAAIRAYTVKLWSDNNIIYRKGTWLTIVLWIISIALHIILNKIGHIGQSTSLIYFAITFTVQSFIVQNRVKRMFF
ncbi:hypothetical protein [Clostridium felsineum]|uniref:hypothetical protein n=1 Tax=Clostridium felsineum TaxID=36839 RepID=UPI00098CBEB7|nr:hypothetical protein [Clostridium felsineum]URZ17487.1 hypothetical protein CLFE_035400 [Clostridium felsineum DSM 794]